MRTVMMLLKAIESIISYSAGKIASGKSLAAVIGIIIHGLVVGILYAAALGLIAFTIIRAMFLIIIYMLQITPIYKNQIPIKTMKGIVSREGFLQRVEAGVNP